MAWLAGQWGDAEEKRRLNLEAVHTLSDARAWLDLVTVLTNLGVSGGKGATAFLALRVEVVEVPAERSLNLAASLLQKLGVAYAAAPQLAMASCRR